MKNILLFLCLVGIISLGNTQIINSDDFCFSKSNLLYMHKKSINNISEFMSKLEYEKVTQTIADSLNLYSSTEAYNYHQWTKGIDIFPFNLSVSVYEYSNKPNIVVINSSKKCFDTLISQLTEFKVHESNDLTIRILSFEIEPGYKQDFREKIDKHSDNPFQIYLNPSPKIEPKNLNEESALNENYKSQLEKKIDLSRKLSDSIKNQEQRIKEQNKQLAQKQKELAIQDSLIKVKQQQLIEQKELEQFLKQEAMRIKQEAEQKELEMLLAEKRKIEELKVLEDMKLQELEETLQKQESIIQSQKESLNEIEIEMDMKTDLLVNLQKELEQSEGQMEQTEKKEAEKREAEKKELDVPKKDSKPHLKVGDPDEKSLKHLLNKCGGEVSGSSSQSALRNYIDFWEQIIGTKYNPTESVYQKYKKQYDRAKLITSN